MKNNLDVLIVEDSLDARDLLSFLLRTENCKVTSADSGEQCLEILAANKNPDVILLDVRMSGMDGFETCKLIKENPKTEDIPILFISADPEEELKDQTEKLKADGYLCKPVNFDDFYEKVEILLQ